MALQRSVAYKEWHRRPITRWLLGTVIIIDLESRTQGLFWDVLPGLNNHDLVRVVTEVLHLRLTKLFPDYEVHVTRVAGASSHGHVQSVTSDNPLKLLLCASPPPQYAR